MINLTNLSNVIFNWRWATKKTIKEAAAEIGISRPALSRIELDGTPDGKTLAVIVRWLLRQGLATNHNEKIQEDEPWEKP